MALILSNKLLSDPRSLIVELVSADQSFTITFLTPHMDQEAKKRLMDVFTKRNDLAEEVKRLQSDLDEAIESENVEEVEKIQAHIQELKRQDDEWDIAKAASKLICGWPDGEIVDERNENKPVSYSEEQRDFLLQNVDGLPMRVFEAWIKQIYSGASKRGNSKAPRKPG